MAGGGSRGASRPTNAAQSRERDDFTDGGTERQMAEPWIPKHKGEALIGKLMRVQDIRTKVSRGDETAPLAEFGPVVIRDERGLKVAYRSLAVMLSSALRLRINRTTDVGKVFAIVYDGTVPSGKGNDMHVFTVAEQPREKLVKMLRDAGVESPDDDLPF